MTFRAPMEETYGISITATKLPAVCDTLLVSMTAIMALDLNWTGRPRSIASALLHIPGTAGSSDSFVLVDPGPSSTLTALREQLSLHGLTIQDLHALFLTHIHLDHAGASGSLVKENSQLQVYVHSRGAAHMADPTNLLRSAGRLWGDELQQLFGDFLPVPHSNLRILEGGETIELGSGKFHTLYTPGHASHHVTYFDALEGTAFVGDTTGICVEGESFILPATPPPDIDIESWDASLDSIAKLHPRRLFLTHFGFSQNPKQHIVSYRECLHQWSELAEKLLASDKTETEMMHAFGQAIAAEAARVLSPDEVAHYNLTAAFHLSWLGLARYHRKRAASAAEKRS